MFQNVSNPRTVFGKGLEGERKKIVGVPVQNVVDFTTSLFMPKEDSPAVKLLQIPRGHKLEIRRVCHASPRKTCRTKYREVREALGRKDLKSIWA
jgi:hypothetical protein